jgi:hypothetical protein
MSLSSDQIETFVETGAVKLENAFERETAEACSNIIFRALGLSPDAPDQWKEPVLRITAPPLPPFREAAASPRLATALDQLVGAGRWTMPGALGAIVARFPSTQKPWDDGWHIDASFPPPDDPQSQDYFQWRVNFRSRDRSMLMLFLFTDCGPDDAPTRVRLGSHLPMARQLASHGEAGVSLANLAKEGFASSDHCEVSLATGEAGTVWLLHPFTVHAAQAHNGTRARFIAQPGLGHREPFDIERGTSPVERAIQLALA